MERFFGIWCKRILCLFACRICIWRPSFWFFWWDWKKKYSNAADVYDYRENYEGVLINKYYCGTALVCSPFFLTAHWLSGFYGFDQDGYSYLYMIFLTLAAVFYGAVGLFYISRLLALNEINEVLISFTLVAILFGSNLFYYTAGELGMSHVYSFAFVSAFLYYASMWFRNNKPKSFIIMSVLFGLIVLIRPVNAIIIFVLPFIAGSQSNLFKSIQGFLKEKITLLISFLVFMLIISIQLIIYKIQTGSFFVYSYQEEGFNFTNPQIFNFLFSYQKGLFLYTPLFLVALFGLLQIYQASKFKFFSIVSFLAFVIYIMHSWWCWFYGGSFSTRVFVEILPLFALLLGIALKSISG